MSWFGNVLNTISDTSVALFEATKKDLTEFKRQLQDDTKNLIHPNDKSTSSSSSSNQDSTSVQSSHSFDMSRSSPEDRWNNSDILKSRSTYINDPIEPSYASFRSQFMTSSHVDEIPSLLLNSHIKSHFCELFDVKFDALQSVTLDSEQKIDFFSRVCFRRSVFQAQEEKRLKLVNKLQQNDSVEPSTSDWDELDDVDTSITPTEQTDDQTIDQEQSINQSIESQPPSQLSSLEPPQLASMSSGEVIDDDEVKAARSAHPAATEDWGDWA